jgi:hypothetical protein
MIEQNASVETYGQCSVSQEFQLEWVSLFWDAYASYHGFSVEEIGSICVNGEMAIAALARAF